MAESAEEALKAAELFLPGPQGPEMSFSMAQIDPQAWRESVERLDRAAAAARRALVDVRAADGLLLPPVANARKEFIGLGEAGVSSLGTAGDLVALIPHLFGADGPKTWFLVIQNPAELRATGGFLGAFGILSAQSGNVTLESFRANDALPELSSPAEAPQEFADNYDRFSSRTFWPNTNMTPDFPNAAEVLANMWQQGTGRRVDGVIAMDAVGLNELLKLVGPVAAEPVGEINSENFLPLALNQAYVRFPEKADRSSFLLEVGQEVWSRLLGGKFSDPLPLLRPMSDLAATKRLQIWSRDEQDRVLRLGVAGNLDPPDTGDYLLVVGQNAGGNKIDYYARRRTTYRVDLSDPENLKGELDVSIQNDAPPAGLPPYIIGPLVRGSGDPPGLNRTFLSVYLPPSTGILRSAIAGRVAGVESKSEQDLQAASQWLEIPSGQTSSLSLETKVSLEQAGVYRLRVQHQPTLNSDRFTLEVEVPDDAVISYVSPGMEIKNNRVFWSGVLDSQKDFLVRYR